MEETEFPLTLERGCTNAQCWLGVRGFLGDKHLSLPKESLWVFGDISAPQWKPFWYLGEDMKVLAGDLEFSGRVLG